MTHVGQVSIELPAGSGFSKAFSARLPVCVVVEGRSADGEIVCVLEGKVILQSIQSPEERLNEFLDLWCEQALGKTRQR